jgi:hypothetical protein
VIFGNMHCGKVLLDMTEVCGGLFYDQAGLTYLEFIRS